MSREVIYRPEGPKTPEGKPRYADANTSGTYYRVYQEKTLVVAYFPYYFASIKEVVADLIELVDSGRVSGPWGEDYAIWISGRIVAVIHQPMDFEHRRIVLFNDLRNDPGPLFTGGTFPGWPSREQWIVSGRGPLEFDLKKYPPSWETA